MSRTCVVRYSALSAAGEKTLAHTRNHVTDLSTESENLFKMATKTKSERTWVQDQNKQNGGKGELNVLKERRLITDPDPYHPNGSHP